MVISKTGFHVVSDQVEAFIADDGQLDVGYCYGGARSVPPDTPDEEVHRLLCRLRDGESRLKNALINRALAGLALAPEDLAALPPGLVGSRVGGARAIFRARSLRAYTVLQDPTHPEFEAVLSPLFERVGRLLNDLGGRIKLTPDFGRFAAVSDLLARYTEHVLGIARASGGCGGKASYTATGIIAVQRVFDPPAPGVGRLTLIGSNGALGRDLLKHYRAAAPGADLTVCDLAYDAGEPPPAGAAVLPSSPGRFTDAALGRGGTIVATTFGGELEASNLDALRPGTLLVLAHNLAVPDGDRGSRLVQDVTSRGVAAVPGPILTLGGALTSRLEWFSRQARPGVPFDDSGKALAHRLVHAVCSALASQALTLARATNVTPHDAMLALGVPPDDAPAGA